MGSKIVKSLRGEALEHWMLVRRMNVGMEVEGAVLKVSLLVLCKASKAGMWVQLKQSQWRGDSWDCISCFNSTVTKGETIPGEDLVC